MNEPTLPTRPPKRNAETIEFWDGCAAGKLLLPKCDRCGDFIWYPRRFCPFCASRSVTFTEVSGRGTIYTFTVVRRGDGPYRDKVPYVLAYITLDEGPTMLTNVVNCDPEAVTIGQRVRVVFEAAGDAGDQLPRFEPA